MRARALDAKIDEIGVQPEGEAAHRNR